MRFTTSIPVRYAETDKMGIVYHANYLLYCEDARTNLLEQLGFPYCEYMEDKGYLSPVVNINVTYGTPFRYGDTVVMRTRIITNRLTKTVYAYEFFDSTQDMDVDKPHATATSTHCVIEADSFKPINIKKVFPELYEKYNEILEPEE